jgi:hypothetical protein
MAPGEAPAGLVWVESRKRQALSLGGSGRERYGRAGRRRRGRAVSAELRAEFRRKLSEDLDSEDPEGQAVERRVVVTRTAKFHHECVERGLDAVFASGAERLMRGPTTAATNVGTLSGSGEGALSPGHSPKAARSIISMSARVGSP